MVRHQGVRSDLRGASSSSDERNFSANGVSSDENNDGYFAFVKRILSYVNPFSYLGVGASTASSRHETQGDARQYSEFLILKISIVFFKVKILVCLWVFKISSFQSLSH